MHIANAKAPIPNWSDISQERYGVPIPNAASIGIACRWAMPYGMASAWIWIPSNAAYYMCMAILNPAAKQFCLTCRTDG